MDQTERNIAIIKRHVEAATAELRRDLDAWIERHIGPAIDDTPDAKFRGPYVAISAALLETALERLIRLHGATAARELVTAAFDRQAEKHRRSLQ